MAYDRFGLLPPAIRAQHVAEMQTQEARSLGPVLDDLQRMDDKIIDLRKFGDDAPELYGAKPNRWHIYRDNGPPAGPSYIPIETPSGGFREPDSGVVNELKERDMWHRKIGEFTSKRMPSAYEDPTRTHEHEQADDEMAEDLRAGLRVAGEGGLTSRKWGRG